MVTVATYRNSMPTNILLHYNKMASVETTLYMFLSSVRPGKQIQRTTTRPANLLHERKIRNFFQNFNLANDDAEKFDTVL